MKGFYRVYIFDRKYPDDKLFPFYGPLAPPSFIDECNVYEFKTIREAGSWMSYELKNGATWCSVVFVPGEISHCDVYNEEELPF